MLYNSLLQYLSTDFNLICLTDSDHKTDIPVRFIDITAVDLDTWWNKVLIFDNSISGQGQNLYFDLDTKIVGNVDFLLDEIEHNKLAVVDTPWKPKDIIDKDPKFYCYGNSSVMGWFGDEHDYLSSLLLSDIFKHTAEHYGDDTFINHYGKIKYFSNKIQHAEKERMYTRDPRILINYK